MRSFDHGSFFQSGGGSNFMKAAVSPKNWVAVKEHNLSYHNPETMLFIICP